MGQTFLEVYLPPFLGLFKQTEMNVIKILAVLIVNFMFHD